MSVKVRWILFSILTVAFVSVTLFVKWQFDTDMQRAHAHVRTRQRVAANPLWPD